MSNIIFKYQEEKGKKFLEKIKDLDAIFFSTIAHTETCKIPGISAAGASIDLIDFTPSADVEALYYGKAICLDKIPENPAGPPSPVIISMASLEILKIPAIIINAGVKIKPNVPVIEINDKYGLSITTGKALKDIDLNKIKKYAEVLAEQFCKKFNLIILGESVPGGTTTAMALINALGVNSFFKVSGSMPTNNHKIKIEVVKKALNYIKKTDTIGDIIKKICDPMQPFQAYFTLEILKRNCNVILAGGSQMIAVAGLMKAINNNFPSENICIATTKWVTEDNYSDLVGLMKNLKLEIPLVSAKLDFSKSKYENLKLYEKGYVKEGVGAGGLAVMVFNKMQISNEEFLKKIEKVYEKIYLIS